MLAAVWAGNGRGRGNDNDHLVVGVSLILISLDDFSSPGRAVEAERRCGQVSFILEQSVSAAIRRRHGQASFASEQAAAGALR